MVERTSFQVGTDKYGCEHVGLLMFEPGAYYGCIKHSGSTKEIQLGMFHLLDASGDRHGKGIVNVDLWAE